jgi:sugar/nucleoside kinase (ribokinase family)
MLPAELFEDSPDSGDESGVLRWADALRAAALIAVDPEGENQIVVAPGANHQALPEHLPARIETPLILQLELPIETVEAAVGRATGFVCVNLAPAAPVSEPLLRRADLLVVNETEAEFYGDLLHPGGGRVVVTLGARGAVMYQRGAEIARATAPKVTAVDATGAGDCFVGAICVALLEGMEPEAAFAFAERTLGGWERRLGEAEARAAAEAAGAREEAARAALELRKDHEDEVAVLTSRISSITSAHAAATARSRPGCV